MTTRLLVLFLGALTACTSAGEAASGPAEVPEPTPPSPRAMRVETAVLAPSATGLALHLPGEVEGSRDALLAAALGGYVERVLVAEGDAVRANRPLVRVDTATHGARLAQARVELAAAERELARATELGDAIARQQLDAARTRVEAARAAVRLAQVQLGRATIRAPFAGVVAELEVEAGEVAAPGAPVARLVRLDPVHVTLAVSDRDVVALQPGMEAHVFANATGAPRVGRVSEIKPAADLRTRAFSVTVEVPNPDRHLLPGMIARVEIAVEGGAEAIVLPQYVLVTRLEGNGVFVAEDGVARWRSVEIDSVVRDQAVIRAGVEAGDEVVVTGQRELADGDPLLVARRGRCCVAGRVVFEQEAAR